MEFLPDRPLGLLRLLHLYQFLIVSNALDQSQLLSICLSLSPTASPIISPDLLSSELSTTGRLFSFEGRPACLLIASSRILYEKAFSLGRILDRWRLDSTIRMIASLDFPFQNTIRNMFYGGTVLSDSPSYTYRSIRPRLPCVDLGKSSDARLLSGSIGI